MNKANNYYGFRIACKNGHIEIVKYLVENINDFDMYKANNNE